jgi:hypothetical protein
VFTARYGLRSLNIIKLRLLTANTQVRSQFTQCEICVGQSGTGQFFLRVPGLPLPILFHQCAMLVFIYMLRLPAGQTGDCWEPRKKKCSFENRRASDRKLFCTYALKVLTCLAHHVKALITLNGLNNSQNTLSNLNIVYSTDIIQLAPCCICKQRTRTAEYSRLL